MSCPVKILHIFSRMNHGGAECRTLDLMRAVDPGEIRMDFCALSGLPGVLDHEIRALGGEVHRLPLKQAGFGRAFRRLLVRERYDVVHSHVHYPSGWILRLAHRAGMKRRIAHFRSDSDGRADTWPRRIVRWGLQRLIDRYATDILAVSRAAMEKAWTPCWQADPRCRVVYNGLDLGRFPDPADVGRAWATRERLGILPETPLYIHVGNVRPAKNHERLLGIFKAVAERTPGAMLMLVGDTLDRTAWLAERLFALGLCPSVRVLGRRDDVPDLLAAADVMIFPSLREGLPGAVLESLAAGTPVVASDLPGIREIAEFLPAIRPVSLAESDRRWADVIAEVTRPGVADRAAARRAFHDSPFTMECHAREMRKLWLEAGPSRRGRAFDKERRSRAPSFALVENGGSEGQTPGEGRSAA
ncbi:MAG: glycosyltransferase family 1 protein [Thermogutta sp.]|nr:glycosyltransferase family 1 protein [Thermogutta sp.]